MNVCIFANTMKRFLILLVILSCAVSCKTDNRVILGDERFGEYLPLLEGQRVAILSNQSGIVGDKVYNWCLEGGQEVTAQSVGIPFGCVPYRTFHRSLRALLLPLPHPPGHKVPHVVL